MRKSIKVKTARIWRFLSPFLIIPGFRPWIEDFRLQSNLLYRGDALHRYILYCLAVIAFSVPFLMYWSETGVDDSNPAYYFGYPPVDAMLRIFLILPPVIVYVLYRDQILFWLDARYGHVARIRRRMNKLGSDSVEAGKAATEADNGARVPPQVEGEPGLE